MSTLNNDNNNSDKDRCDLINSIDCDKHIMAISNVNHDNDGVNANSAVAAADIPNRTISTAKEHEEEEEGEQEVLGVEASSVVGSSSPSLSAATTNTIVKAGTTAPTTTATTTTAVVPQQQQQLQLPKNIHKYLCLAPRPEEFHQYYTNMMMMTTMVQSPQPQQQVQQQSEIKKKKQKNKIITKQQIIQTLQYLYPRYSQYYTSSTTSEILAAASASSSSSSVPPLKLPNIQRTTSTSTSTTTSSGSSNTKTTPFIIPSKVIGPGRKSNAEYAILFYEYLLQHLNDENNNNSDNEVEDNDNDDDDDIDEEGDIDDNDDVDHEDELDVVDVNDGSTDKGNHDDDDDDIEEDVEVEESVNDITTQQQHQISSSSNKSSNNKSSSTTIKGSCVCHVCCQSMDTDLETTTSNTDNNNNKKNSYVQCTTCPNMFHKQCVRPKIIDDDDNEHDQVTTGQSSSSVYKCAYCILATYKRNDRYRKTAAAAVRFMARLRNQVVSTTSIAATTTTSSSKTDASKRDDDKDCISTVNNDDNVKNKSDDANTETKINVFTATESSSPNKATPIVVPSTTATTISSSSVSSPSPRASQRHRKQPTLYNPQDGPASRWQTDELTEWKLQRAKEEEEEEEKLRKEQEQHVNLVLNNTNNNTNRKTSTVKGDRKGSGPVVCIFCQDDPNVPVCVFCACRICFGKHCQSELLLCDQCDDEYHIFCLNPPLSSVPGTNQPWFCDQCTTMRSNPNTLNTTDIVKSDSLARSSRRSSSSTSTTETTKKSNVGAIASPMSKVSDDPNSPTNQRRSLRSPKLSVAAMMMISNKLEMAPEKSIPQPTVEKKVSKSSKFIFTKPPPPPKRPRGRPPKNSDTSPMNSASEHSSNTSNSKQITSSDGVVVVKRKPGRPPLKLTEGNKFESIWKPPTFTSSSQKQQQQPMVKKRGRPPSAETIAKRAKLESWGSSKGSSANPQQQRASKSNKSKSFFDSSQQHDTMSITSQLSIANPSINSDPNNVTIPAPPVTISRSGRTVRRSNFHDELGEGEQHLKSARYNADCESSPSPSPRNMSNMSNTNILLSESQHSFGQSNTSNTISMNAENVPGQLATSKQNTAVSMAAASAVAQPASGNVSAAYVQQNVNGTNDSDISLTIGNGLGESEEYMDTNPDYEVNYEDCDSLENTKMSAESASEHVNTSIHDGATSGNEQSNSLQSMNDATQEEQQQQNQAQGIGIDMSKQPRRKPGARECMQISRRFGVKEIPQHYMDILLDYCNRGKVEHLIRMRERLDEHSRFLEMQLAGLEALVLEHGESDIVVPLAPPSPDRRHE